MDSPSASPGPPDVPAVTLTYWNVLFGFGFVLVDALLSLALGLRIERSLLIAALRCVVQLWLMGFVLKSVFESRNIFAVAAVSVLLNLLGAWEVVFSKSKRRHKGMFFTTLFSMLITTLPISAVGSHFALSQRPFWEPMRYVPTLGMILGNAIGGIGVGVGYTLTQFSENKDKIETLLAHGATRLEASRPVAIDALRIALLPIINQMSIIGLISIPGMMTGALLSGTPVDQATKLQTIIMFILSASTALSVLLSILASLRVLVDDKHRIRPDRILPKHSGFFTVVAKGTRQLWDGVVSRIRHRGGRGVQLDTSEEEDARA